MLIHGEYIDNHSNFVIRRYPDKGVMVIHGIHGGCMDNHSKRNL